MIWIVIAYSALSLFFLGFFSVLVERQKSPPGADMCFAALWPLSLLMMAGIALAERGYRKAASE